MSLSSCSFSLLFFTLLLSIPPLSSAQQQQKSISSFSSSDSPWHPYQNQVLLSPNSTFAAGFRSLPASPELYVFSVWYYISENTVVWSVNTNSSVNSSGTLVITPSGELRLSYPIPSSQNLWPLHNIENSNTSTKLSLGDNGELVFGRWRSFDYPTNTILPTQPINGTTLSSNNGKFKLVRSQNLVFGGDDCYHSEDNAYLMLASDGTVSKANGGSFASADYGEDKLRRLTLDEDGNLRLYSFHPKENKWRVSWQAIYQLCTIHGTCGPNYICMYDDQLTHNNSTHCQCPVGFKLGRSDNGEETCERKSPVPNRQNSKFLRFDYVNFTGGSNQTDLRVQDFSTCEAKCLDEPTCLGFMFKYDGTGYCVLQLERLLHGYWSPGTEVVMFLRVDKSETDETNFSGMTEVLNTTCPVRLTLPFPPEEPNTTTRNIVLVCTLFAAELIGGVAFFWAFVKRYIKYRDMARTFGLEFLPAGGPKRFGYAELKLATNDFANDNIIGRGGFGDVYMGKLSDSRVVAIKCLKDLTGGDAVFWAEVTIIARMHHLNLVRLWGFCAEKGKRILVYEYVPNGSLDKFLFQKVGPSETQEEMGVDPERKPVLDWNIRYRISVGVARAIAYLHEECLEWVLHCDIKPENILLGDDFCPKISDFGLAKLRKKEDIVTMSHIRGTRGYMAPEWVKMEQITSKADVYSFGMVLLEMVSGIRNFEVQGSEVDSEEWYLPRWAFEKVFKEMKVEDVLDSRIKQSYDSRTHFNMVNRMVKTAMWCLQDQPESRPSMGKVAKMLEGTVEIEEPKRPTIFFLDDEQKNGSPVPDENFLDEYTEFN